MQLGFMNRDALTEEGKAIFFYINLSLKSGEIDDVSMKRRVDLRPGSKLIIRILPKITSHMQRISNVEVQRSLFFLIFSFIF